MSSRINLLGGIIATILVVLAMSIFTVDQRQYALVFQLGEVKKVITEPGLNFKIPMIQNVRYFEKRIIHWTMLIRSASSLRRKRMCWLILTSSGALLIPAFTTFRLAAMKRGRGRD